MGKKLLIICFVILAAISSYGQCDPNVPTLVADLTGSPDSVWLSPNISRQGNCCGTTNPDNCIEFIITLDPGATGISFDIVAGAVPGGALFYQVNCGPQTALGEPICLVGTGPHLITFCKPGNNANIYQITSIPGPVAGTDVTINDGCVGSVGASGFDSTSVTWTSIFPGTPGQYDNYLSCTTGCLNPTVTAVGTPPPFVDYIICGIPASQCDSIIVCDTVRANFNPTLNVVIVPQNPTICFGQTSTTITAIGSGGTPPYSYLWNNVNPSQSNIVGAGTYTVELSDASGCPPVYATVTVTAFANPITADAGPDDTVCIQSPIATLNGIVTGASGGQWSGGGGTFSPNDSTLTNAFYIPTAAELANGFVDLYLNTTGNGTCPPDADTVRIFFIDFIGTPTLTTTDVTCFGASDGTATAGVTGGIPPFTYAWNTFPSQNGPTATGLGPGTYTVTITNGIGCVTDTSVTITQPTPLQVYSTTTDVSCAGGSDGSVTGLPSGGTQPYTYAWVPGGQNTVDITGQPAGIYTLTVSDANGCIATVTDTVFEPLPITITSTQTNVSCFGGADGSITSTATGGTGSFTYSWSPSGGTAATATGLMAGTYTLTVTDSLGCTATETVVITEPTVLTVTATGTDETCDYLDNGTATATAAGGSGGYTYMWTPGNFTTSTVGNLAAGTYTVVVTDVNGCTATTFVVINEPPPLTVIMSQINVNCFGGNTGVANASTSGGTPGYSYVWTPGGATTASITGLTAGTYIVDVTDNNGCTTQNSVTITQPLQPVTVSTSMTAVSCNGGSDGTATANTTGGTGPYTYLWIPGGQTTATATGLTAGNYTVTVTDSLGCVETANITVTEPAPLAVTFATTSVSCNGGSNGTATATVTGGTAAYSYSWSPSGGNTAGVSGLSAGMHVLTITDNNGCVLVDSVLITEPTPVVANAATTDETCDYANDGVATALPSGGIPGYTYLWMPGSLTTATISGQSAGIYTLTVTDNNGCPATTTVTIGEPMPLAITFSSQVNVSCNGGSDGAVTATASGGTPNYSYSWAPGGATTNSISGLAAGTYTVTVTDANGCQFLSSVTITEPTPVASAPTSTPTSCFGGSNGTASANASGGTAPYTYNWMPGSISGATATGLSAGTYYVTITDANGCAHLDSVNVLEPGQIILTPGAVNSNCGLANGEAHVVVASGGTGPFNFLWTPGGGTNDTITGLVAGSYTVLVTDANGCTSTTVATVNDNAGPIATISGFTNIDCNGASTGSATVNITGGIGPFGILWSPSGQTVATATNLPAGTHTVTVTGSNGCVATASITLTEPTPLSVNVTPTPVSCFGGNNGAASISVGGGTPGYTYLWMPGGTTGNNVSGLPAGTDSVQVMDANGCTIVETFTITQPAAAVSVIASGTNISCAGGSDGTVSAAATGGTAPYNYNWTPGNIGGQGISSLPIGTYTITVTDFNGCTATDAITLTEPTPIVLTMDSVNSTCGGSNGTATVVATGGTGGYNYQWSPTGGTNATATGLVAGTYIVTVTDGNSCVATATVDVLDTPGPTATVTGTTNVTCPGGSDGTATVTVTGGTAGFTYQWSPLGGTGATATNLPAGTYSVVVTDANGCVTPAVFSAPITQPDPIVSAIATSDVSCNGGSDGAASVTSFGGTPGYTYQWLPGGATGASVTGLPAGLDSVEVTDANGCIQVTPFMINEPPVLTSLIINQTNVSCFGGANGSAEVLATGGTPIYSYVWAPSGGTNPIATGLTAGNYTCTVTDINGCTSVSNVTITEPSQALTATANVTNVSCFGGSDGSATINPTGGTPAFTYQWAPSGGSGQTATGLSAGNYTVLVTDQGGCQTNVALTVTEPTPIVGNLLVVHPSCGLNNGSIGTAVSGGVSPYTYAWTPGAATTPAINGLGPGNYSVDVTDNQGCVLTLNTTLIDIPGPVVTIPTSTNVSCFGGSNGTATANITGGTSPFSIVWTPTGGTNLMATGLPADTYTATVTDGLGCIGTETVVITEPTPLTVSILSLSTVTCNGGSDGEITVTGVGGTAPYSYSWAPGGSTSPTISNLVAGVYDVTVTDFNGCTSTLSITMTEPTTLFSSIGFSQNPSCFGVNDGSASVVVTGGTIPYAYLWSNGQTGSTAVNMGDGFYSVTVTDSNGCTTSTNVTLTEPTQVVTVAGPNDTICIGQNGTITATASGGNGNYSYAWQPNGVTNAGTLTDSPLLDEDYIVIAYDQNGCAGTADTVSIIVNQLTPNDVLTFAYSPLCPGQSTAVYVTTPNITDSLTYTWNQGLGPGPGAFIVTPLTPTTYIVTVTNSCGTTVTDSVQVTFNPPPTMAIFASADSVCVPATIQFSDSSITGNPNDPITSWFWDFGDGNSSTDQHPSHTYTQPGTYNVTLTVTTDNGCTNDNLGTPLVVSAFSYPDAQFTVNDTQFDLPHDELITTNQSTDAVAYWWDFGDGSTSTDTDPTYLYTTVGVYDVMLVAYNEYGCTDTARIEITTNADLVFPNAFTPNTNGPSGGYYDISNLSNDIFFPYTSGVVDYKLQIFNRWGELVFETFDVNQGWDGYYRGVLSQQGVYVYKAYARLNNGRNFSQIGDVTLLR